jgi:hypothetical protein
MSSSSTAVKSPSRREARRSGKRKSPRELADAAVERGEITPDQLLAARARVLGRECSTTWGEDVWHGRDRDYPAEARLRAKGKTDPRVFTGSGPFKRRCACCRRDVPPQHCPGEVCAECRFEGAGEYMLHNTPGSSGHRLRGEDA